MRLPILFLALVSLLSFSACRSKVDPFGYNPRGYAELNILLVGQSGTGKSSCINSIFNSTVIPKKGVIMTSTKQRTLYRKIMPFTHIDMDLRVIDTVGFGDNEDVSHEQKSLLQLMSGRLGRHKATVQSPSPYKAEGRIHLVIYFLDPHRIKRTDRRFIARIAPLAKVAVVISKADSLTDPERAEMKKQVQLDLGEVAKQYPGSFLRDSPYAVICESRVYSRANITWDVNDPDHSDLPTLRLDMLLTRFEHLGRYADMVYDRHLKRVTIHADILFFLWLFIGFIILLAFVQGFQEGKVPGWIRALISGDKMGENDCKDVLGVLVSSLIFAFIMTMIASWCSRSYSPFLQEEVARWTEKGTTV